MEEDPKSLVARGYDALSQRYDVAFDGANKYQPWLDELCDRVPAGGTVLDLGCGSGLPVARELVAAGYRVTGVDISGTQVERARQLVAGAEFVHADAAAVRFPPASFDAVVCLYALIHMPLDDQPALLARIAGWLRPGGWFLGTTGEHAWTGSEEDWLGSGVTMWWSHADAATYREWLTAAGLTVERQEVVPEGVAEHALFWARHSGSAEVPAAAGGGDR